MIQQREVAFGDHEVVLIVMVQLERCCWGESKATGFVCLNFCSDSCRSLFLT